jgi:hypothetical protein
VCFVFVLVLAHEVMSQEILPVATELWIREVDADTTYESDGLNIYNSLVSAPGAGRRISVLEFDLSGLSGSSYSSVRLDIYSMEEWSSANYPVVSEAYVIDTAGVSIAGMTWNSYLATYDAGKVALDTLGAYDYGSISTEPNAYDTYMTSLGSESDLARVMAETAGDDLLTIVILAVETGYEVRGDWEDDVYMGNRGFLTFVPVPNGKAYSPSVTNGASDVSPEVTLGWEFDPGYYNEAATFEVYLDTESDFSDVTPIETSTTASYNPLPDMEYDTTYFWRVDVTDDNGGDPITYTGETWTFTTLQTAVPTRITVTTEGWLREQTDSFYEDDALNIYNSQISSGDQRRITLLEFDLSSLAPGPYSSVTLDLYSMDEWSSSAYPVVSEAFIVEMGGELIENLTWGSYFSIYDPNAEPLDSLGAYDYGSISTEASAYDTYMTSISSGADLAKVLAEKTGDNKLTIVIKAVETGYEVRSDWEDDVYMGNRGFLTFFSLTEKAYSPGPFNEASNVEANVTISWEAGLDATAHHIYFGTDYNTVEAAGDPNSGSGQGVQSLGNESYTPGSPLDFGTTYFWRIDEVNASGTTKGDIWEFTTLVDTRVASEPDPVDGAYVVSRSNVDLSWTADAGTSQHHIYFGADYALVNTASDPNTPPGRGVGTLGNESYTVPELLDIGGTYFGRVDEVNGGETFRGPVWSLDVTSSDPTTCEGMLSLGFGSTVDFDNNCNFNLVDLAALAGEWLSAYDMDDVRLLAQKWLDSDDPEDANGKRPWQELVETCMDTLIVFGTDTYGAVHTPMFMSIIDVNSLSSPEDPLVDLAGSNCEGNVANDAFYDACVRTEGRPRHGRLSPGGSNAWLDQPLIKAMYLCSQMTSDTTYSEAADAYMSYFMDNCKKANGIFYWGSHSYWNAFTESYNGDGQHEILIKHADWENLYRLNASAVTAEVEGIWERHICDKNTGQHNRHDSGSCGIDFAFSGGSFIIAFSHMYKATGEQVYLDRARLIADWHWNSRNLTTGLMPDRAAGHDYCNTSDVGPHASQLLLSYELTGETAFRDYAISYIKAYEEYGWNDADRNYYGILNIGDGAPELDSGSFGGYSANYYPVGYVDVWRTIMYTYEFPLIAAQTAVYAYELSDIGGGVKDPELLTIAEHWAEVIENNMPSYPGRRWEDVLETVLPDIIKTEGTYAENYGRAISFFVHLYRATGNQHYQDLAESLAVEAVEKLYTNGIFKGHPAKPYYQSNDGVGFLLYALLELQDVTVSRHGAF